MPSTVVTFDLVGATSEDYTLAYQVLAQLGFSRSVGAEAVGLPNTTVLGKLSHASQVQLLRDQIEGQFRTVGLEPAAIFIGVMDGEFWTARRW